MSPDLVTVLHSNNAIPQRCTWNHPPTAFPIHYLFWILQLVKWRRKKKNKKSPTSKFLTFFLECSLKTKLVGSTAKAPEQSQAGLCHTPGRSHGAFLESLSLCPTLHPPGRETPLFLGVLPMGWFPGEGGKQGEGCGENGENGENVLPSGTGQSHRRTRAEGLGQTFGTSGSCHPTDPTNY